MNSELNRSRISIMGISNDLKFTDFLDPRVKSSLGEEEIVFPPYDANQLRDILQHRADISFKQDALTDDVLCAAFALRNTHATPVALDSVLRADSPRSHGRSSNRPAGAGVRASSGTLPTQATPVRGHPRTAYNINTGGELAERDAG